MNERERAARIEAAADDVIREFADGLSYAPESPLAVLRQALALKVDEPDAASVGAMADKVREARSKPVSAGPQSMGVIRAKADLAVAQMVLQEIEAAYERGRQDYATNEAVQAKLDAFAAGFGEGAEGMRERCAKACENYAISKDYDDDYMASALDCAAEIRALPTDPTGREGEA